MITSLFNFFLAYIVRGILPPDILIKIDRPEKLQEIVDYIKTSISLSPIYVKAPEILLRIALFFMIFAFRLIEICSQSRVSLNCSISVMKKIHPLLDDGIRLYLLLAMFAVFEEDSFRQNHGFPTYSEILKRFGDLEFIVQDKN